MLILTTPDVQAQSNVESESWWASFVNWIKDLFSLTQQEAEIKAKELIETKYDNAWRQENYFVEFSNGARHIQTITRAYPVGSFAFVEESPDKWVERAKAKSLFKKPNEDLKKVPVEFISTDPKYRYKILDFNATSLLIELDVLDSGVGVPLKVYEKVFDEETQQIQDIARDIEVIDITSSEKIAHGKKQEHKFDVVNGDKRKFFIRDIDFSNPNTKVHLGFASTISEASANALDGRITFKEDPGDCPNQDEWNQLRGGNLSAGAFAVFDTETVRTDALKSVCITSDSQQLHRSILQFDVPDLSGGSVTQTILAVNGETNYGTFTVQASSHNGSLAANAATWNSANSTKSLGNVSTASDFSEWTNVTLNSEGNNHIDDNGVTSFMLREKQYDFDGEFSTSANRNIGLEYSEGTNSPYLEITSVDNNAPTIDGGYLNSTDNGVTNNTNQNITAGLINPADADLDPLTHVFDFRKSNISIASLNMPLITLDDTNATLAKDYTTNANHGNVIGAVCNSTGLIGGACHFDGVNDFIEVDEDLEDGKLLNGFTISAWINPTGGLGSSSAMIADKSTGTIGNDGFSFAYRSDFNTTIIYVDGTSPRLSATNSVLHTEKLWYHVLVTIDSSALASHYINGQLSGTPGTTGALAGITTTNKMKIGNRATTTDRPFDGAISQVQIWNRTLGSDEIQSIYANESNKFLSINTAYQDSISALGCALDGQGGEACLQSSEMKIQNNAPSFDDLGLNTTLDGSDNTTGVTYNITSDFRNTNDIDSDALNELIDWRKGNVSLAILNLPLLPDQDNSTRAKDLSTNLSHGELFNNVFLNGSGGQFDGVNDYIDLGSDLNFNTTFTWSAWIKPSTTSATGVIISQPNGYFISRNTNRFTFGRTGIAHDVTSDAIIPINTPTFVSATVNETGQVELFINGVSDKTGTTTVINAETITRISDTTSDYSGQIANVTIHNRVLTAREHINLFEGNSILHSDTLTANGRGGYSALGCLHDGNNETCIQSASLERNGMVPTDPVLQDPANNSLIGNESVNLIVVNSTDADGDDISYECYADSSNPPTTLVGNDTTGNYNVTTTGDVFWRCRAGDGIDGVSNYTETRFYKLNGDVFLNTTFLPGFFHQTDKVKTNLSVALNKYRYKDGTSTLLFNGEQFTTTKTTGANTTEYIDLTFDREVIIPSTGSANITPTYSLTLTKLDDTTEIQNISTSHLLKPIDFGLCNATLTQPFINFTSKDEATDAQIDFFNITSGTLTFSLDTNLEANKSISFSSSAPDEAFAFCASPENKTLALNANLNYDAEDYTSRNYVETNALTLTTLNEVLYLLLTSSGSLTTFQVITAAEQTIEGVSVNAQINGNIVESGTTDDAGTVTFFVDPTQTYTFTFTKSGFISQSLTINPSQSIYTVTMETSSGVTNQTNLGIGIQFGIGPENITLANQTSYPFSFNVNSSFFALTEVGFVLTDENGTGLATASCTSNETICTASSTFVTSNEDKIIMNFYYAITQDGVLNYQNGTKFWIVTSTQSNIGAMGYLILDLQAFGSDLNDFTKAMISLFIVIVTTGILSFNSGLFSPVAILAIIFFEVAFLDHINLIPVIFGAVPNFIPIVMGVIFLGYLFYEYQR